MPHRISWPELAGRRVGVWGLGVEGRSNLRRLLDLGVAPVVVDDRPPGDAPVPVLSGADGGLEALAGCEVVVKSPGISSYLDEVRTLEEGGVAVVGGLGLWLAEVDRDRVVCVTGTKGKSTTTAIAAHLATGLGLRAVAGGNLGSPPWDPDAPTDADLWVIETSSYQAVDVAVAPPVVAVTSLSPDHLPWHGDEATYYRDKLSLCTRPGARVTVASAASPPLVERRDLLGPEVRWVDAGTWPREWCEPLGLLGAHNVVNAAVARAVLEVAGVPGADDDGRLRRAAEGFRHLEARLEVVGTLDGVDFVDDTLSTNVLPTLAAVDAFPDRRVALVAGGADRGIDYGPLARGLATRPAPTLVLTCYSTGPRILDAVRRGGGAHLAAEGCADLAEAVRRGWEWARPGGVVLLSPAAPSFDAFDDYRHKGRAFRAAVAALATPPGAGPEPGG